MGIINIVLKKQQRNGLNGSFEVTTGYPDNHGVSFSLNHRSRHVNLFSSYGFAYRRAPGRAAPSRKSTGDTTFRYEREREPPAGPFAQPAAGRRHLPDPKQTLTLSGLYRDGLSNNDALLIYRDLDGAGHHHPHHQPHRGRRNRPHPRAGAQLPKDFPGRTAASPPT